MATKINYLCACGKPCKVSLDEIRNGTPKCDDCIKAEKAAAKAAAKAAKAAEAENAPEQEQDGEKAPHTRRARGSCCRYCKGDGARLLSLCDPCFTFIVSQAHLLALPEAKASESEPVSALAD